MALENATYISQLVPSNPVSTDSVAQADDHLRLIKSTLKTTFPNLNAPVTVSAAALNSLDGTNTVPAGLIAMWFGSVGSIPTGWLLCDGTKGTPNLQNKFIVGAGDTYAPNAFGGSVNSGLGGGGTFTTSAAGAHSHSGVTQGTALTVSQLPSHTHTWTGTSTSEDNNYTAGAVKYLKENSTVNSASFTETTDATGAGETHSHVISSEAAHTHSTTLSDHTHSVLPPYYALCYIMKA